MSFETPPEERLQAESLNIENLEEARTQPKEPSSPESTAISPGDAGPLEGTPDKETAPAVEEPVAASAEIAAAQASTAPPPATVATAPTLTLTPAAVSRDLVTLHPDDSSLAASYERVAGKVLNRSWRRTSLFFTSTQANEGSTAVAVNVATMLSRNAESTLLVELQLTEPSLWSLFGRPAAAAGFEEALRGHSRFDDCLYKIGGEKLDVLLVKQAMAVNEMEHLSGMLNDFLEWAEERFAWLVVDCPPVLAGSWTRWFDLNADPVVLVAGRTRAKKYELRKVAQRLGDRLVGTILNETSASKRAS